jgi:hypothetical protein
VTGFSARVAHSAISARYAPVFKELGILVPDAAVAPPVMPFFAAWDFVFHSIYLAVMAADLDLTMQMMMNANISETCGKA